MDTAAGAWPTAQPARPRRLLRAFPLVAGLLDAGLIVTAMLLGVLGRRHLEIFPSGTDVSSALTVSGPAVFVVWLAVLALYGAYSRNVFGAGTDEYKRIVNASVLAAGLVGVGCYLAKFQLSRGFFVIAFVAGVPLLVVGRYLLRKVLHRARRNGHLLQRTLLVGSPLHVDDVGAVLQRESWLGYHPVGALTPAHFTDETTPGGHAVVGNPEDLASLAERENADVIFIVGGAFRSSQEMRRVIWDLEHQDIQVVIAPSVTEVSPERVRIRPVGGLPLMHLDPPRTLDASHWGKRLFDLVGSGFLLVALSPLFLVAAIAIKRFDGGPVYFGQTRVGKDGAEFTCLKLRTMVVDAEARLAELVEEQGHAEGLFKMQEDPRITGPGKWLRRYSIDEVPQLINVLRGEMSLVGPRPPLPSEVATYDDDVHRRLHVRPGMTGLWQVSGRSDLSWSEAVRLDLYYVDNWSMMQDLGILLRTFGAVFGSRGAY